MWMHALPVQVASIAMTASAATVYGFAALWAVGGRAHCLARVAPVTLLLAALMPIGALALLVVFGTQVATIVVWGLAVRLFRATREARRQGASWLAALHYTTVLPFGKTFRFRLRDVLAAFLLAGVVLAVLRASEPNASSNSFERAEILPVVVCGLILGGLTLSAQWIIVGGGRRWYRIGLLSLTAGTLCGWLHWQMPLSALNGVGCTLAILAFLGVVHYAGWAPWPRPKHDPQQALPARSANAPRLGLRWFARCVTVAAVVALSAVLIPAYRVMLPGPPPVAAELPSPNAYDELVALEQKVNWTAIPTEDVDAASVDALRQFVEDNAGVLELVHQALTKPCRVPVVDDMTAWNNLVYPRFRALRSLTRALYAEAKWAAAEGRYVDAANIHVDVVAFGDLTENGGMVVDRLLSHRIEAIGLAGLEPLIGQLASTDLAACIRRLESSAATREPIERVIERDDAVSRNLFGWAYRLLKDSPDSELAYDYTFMALECQRSDAYRRLVLAEMAVRRYMVEHGAPPESMAALVPGYLRELPLDPFGDGPLVYRTTDDGYLLYSVGVNGTDDGGQRATYIDAVVSGIGDFFFDAPHDSDEPGAENETDTTPDGATDENQPS